MDKMDCNLSEYLSNNLNLSEEKKVDIIRQIVKGVSYLHENHIIHRD